MTLDEQCFWQAVLGLTGIFSPYLRNREEGSQCPSWVVGRPMVEGLTLCKYTAFCAGLVGLLPACHVQC